MIENSSKSLDQGRNLPLNARSLNKNFQKIKDSIDDLKLYFDIIAISETWAETDTVDGFTLNGYEAFHIVRGQRK